MAKLRYWIPKPHAQARVHFISERLRIEKHFPCFRCKLSRNRLLCRGVIAPAEGCDSYYIKVDYVQGGTPRVYITKPAIKPSNKYHMYNDGQLCLYDHRESPWSERMTIHDTIIPWTAEWIVFYEIWKITGQWLGEAAQHGTGEKVRERMITNRRDHELNQHGTRYRRP